MKLKRNDKHVDSRSGNWTANAFFFQYSMLPILGLFPKTHVKIQKLFLSGLVVQWAKNKALLIIHYLVFPSVPFWCIEWKNGDFVAGYTNKWNMTWPSFLLCLTQSLILHQDSKNTVAIAYLCFLLFHFIIVPIVSLIPGSCNFSQLIMQSLKWQPQTHLPSSWLQRIHKTASKKRLYLGEKQLQLSFVTAYYSG